GALELGRSKFDGRPGIDEVLHPDPVRGLRGQEHLGCPATRGGRLRDRAEHRNEGRSVAPRECRELDYAHSAILAPPAVATPGAPPGTEKVAIETLYPLDHLLNRELAAAPLARRLPHAPRLVAVAEQRGDGRADGGWVPGRHEPSVHPVLDQVRNAAHAG